MRTDTWDEITNDPSTYASIVAMLQEGRPVAIGWTDGRSSHHDLLFALSPIVVGRLQALHPRLSLHGERLLLVGVMRCGSFAFYLDDPAALHPEYVAEKLNVGGATAEALAQLINGVLDTLRVAAP